MARDALEAVLRLRRSAVDQARLALSEAIAAEAGARAELRAAEQAIEAEERVASDPDGGDGVVEAFARWLPTGRARADGARAEAEKRAADLERSRAELTLARTGLEVIETLLREKRDRLAAEEARRAQGAIDEAAGRRRFDGSGAGRTGDGAAGG